MNSRRGRRTMGGENAHTPPPAKPQEKPLLQAILQFLSRWSVRIVVALFLSWVWLCDQCVRGLQFLGRHKLTIGRNAWSSLFRIATLLSVAYLVFDRLYETEATVSAPASDPNDPFLFPFSIQNNSHLFPIKNVRWACEYLSVKAAGLELKNSVETEGGPSFIPPGRNLNFSCQGAGTHSKIIRTLTPPKFNEAIIRISLAYEVDIFGRYTWTRLPPRTIFTWAATASNPQWIKGDFAK